MAGRTVRVHLGFGNYAELEPDEYEVDREFLAPLASIPTSALPGIGTRVRLRHAVDRYPHFLVDAGAEGTVVHTPSGDPAGSFCVRMDEHVAGAEDWENEIVWMPSDGDDPMRDLEVVS